MGNTALISICIPVFNSESFIGPALESCLSQTYPNIEIIVSDNASTDTTASIVKEYGLKDERIRYFRNNTNVGMVNNWNTAIGYAQGDFIKLLCSDDLMDVDCIEQQYDALRSNPGCVLTTNNVRLIDASGKVIFQRKNAVKTLRFSGIVFARKSFMTKNTIGEPSSVLFSKDAYDKAGGFDPRFSYVPDWDMWIRMLFHGDLIYISECLSSYRVSRKSMTNQLAKKKTKTLRDEDLIFVNKVIESSRFKISRSDLIFRQMSIRLRSLMRKFFYSVFVR